MVDQPSSGPDTATPSDGRMELRREACTMALYVAICLLAALAAVKEPVGDGDAHTFELVWGTTLGLALAHWFAFRLSARLVASGAFRREDAEAAGAQLAGAVAVALLATIPVLVLPATVELDVVRLVLAAFIALVGVTVARSSGASGLRSVVYGLSILAVGAVVALVKNVLAGH
jgi:hypothetical protein